LETDGSKGECGGRINLPNRRRKRVVGGRKAQLGEFPYNVLVGYENDILTEKIEIYYLSAGVVLNKWYIITVAHIFEGQSGLLSELILGETLVGSDPLFWRQLSSTHHEEISQQSYCS